MQSEKVAEAPERTPIAIKSVEQLQGIHRMDCIKVIHATTTSCKACGRLKREVGPELDAGVCWAVVSMQDVEGAQEEMGVDTLPRIDVVSASGAVTSLAGFDCTREAVLEAVKHAKDRVLVLDADF